MARNRRSNDDTERRSKAHPQPDESGEGTLAEDTNQGGFQPRLLSDQDDPPLAEQMADQMDLRKDWERRRKPKEKPHQS
jgi:hypothetical protein